jgi:hypothetical protein
MGVTGGRLEYWNVGILEDDSASPVSNSIIPIFHHSSEVMDEALVFSLNLVVTRPFCHG